MLVSLLYLDKDLEQEEWQCLSDFRRVNPSARMHVMVQSPYSGMLLDIEGYHEIEEYRNIHPFKTTDFLYMYITAEQLQEMVEQSDYVPQDMEAAKLVANSILEEYGIK